MNYLERQSNIRLAALFYFSAVTVYTPFLPLDIETQPILFVFSVAFALLVNGRNGAWPETQPSQLWIIIYILLICAWSSYSLVSYGYLTLVQVVKFLLPVLVFFVNWNCLFTPSYRIQNFVAFLHLLLIGLFLTGNAQFLASFYGRYTADLESVRGFSFLSYEPSYASTYLFTLFLVARYGADLGGKRVVFAELTYLLAIILTKSLLGLAFCSLAVLSYLRIDRSFLRFMITSVFALFAAVAIWGSSNSRLSEIKSALSSLDSSDILLSVVLFEPSGTSRFLINLSSFKEGFDSISGYGIGSFSVEWPKLPDVKNSDLIGSNFLLNEFLDEGRASPQSYFAVLCFETGFLGYFFLFGIAFYFLRNRIGSNIWWVIVGYFLIVVLFQSQTSNPLYFFSLLLLKKALDQGFICMNQKSHGF